MIYTLHIQILSFSIIWTDYFNHALLQTHHYETLTLQEALASLCSISRQCTVSLNAVSHRSSLNTKLQCASYCSKVNECKFYATESGDCIFFEYNSNENPLTEFLVPDTQLVYAKVITGEAFEYFRNSLMIRSSIYNFKYKLDFN